MFLLHDSEDTAPQASRYRGGSPGPDNGQRTGNADTRAQRKSDIRTKHLRLETIMYEMTCTCDLCFYRAQCDEHGIVPSTAQHGNMMDDTTHGVVFGVQDNAGDWTVTETMGAWKS